MKKIYISHLSHTSLCYGGNTDKGKDLAITSSEQPQITPPPHLSPKKLIGYACILWAVLARAGVRTAGPPARAAPAPKHQEGGA